MAKRKGTPNEEVAGAILPILSHANMTMVEKLLDNHDSKGAALYTTAHNEEFTSQDLLHAQKLVSVTGDMLTAQQTVDVALAKTIEGKPATTVLSGNDLLTNAVGYKDANPETRRQIEDRAEQEAARWNQQRKANEDNAMSKGFTWVSQHPGAPYTSMPTAIRSEIIANAPDGLAKLSHYATALTPDAEGNAKVQTNLVAYSKVLADPTVLAKMTDTEFNYFSNTQLAPAQRIPMAALRGEVLSGKIADSPDSLNPIANQIIDNRLRDLKIKPKEDEHRAAQIRTTVIDGLYAQQKQNNKKMNEREVVEAVNKAFDMTQSKPSFFSRLGASPTTSPILGVKEVRDIPSSEVEATRAKLAKSGILNPSDDEIIKQYQWERVRGQPRQ
jgi:hypothetical protein